MLHGPQRGVFDLRFELPAECAETIASGRAEIGLVPSIEIERQGLEVVAPGLGIASDGPVRSILLVSKVSLREIHTVAMDASSRTSVALTRILLAEKYGVLPRAVSRKPELPQMLVDADAALLIGDPALRFDAESSPYETHDLGREWREWTGLPMVYAQWAGRAVANAEAVLQGSYEYGRGRLDEIVRMEADARGFPEAVAREYLTRNIVHELGPEHAEGLRRFLELARGLTAGEGDGVIKRPTHVPQ